VREGGGRGAGGASRWLRRWAQMANSRQSRRSNDPAAPKGR
jgi:hypothetical protein